MYSQLRTACKTAQWQFTDDSFGPMKFNDSHVKCTSLQVMVNTNHMKVASDSIGPCDCHVTTLGYFTSNHKGLYATNGKD